MSFSVSHFLATHGFVVALLYGLQITIVDSYMQGDWSTGWTVEQTSSRLKEVTLCHSFCCEFMWPIHSMLMEVLLVILAKSWLQSEENSFLLLHCSVLCFTFLETCEDTVSLFLWIKCYNNIKLWVCMRYANKPIYDIRRLRSLK